MTPEQTGWEELMNGNMITAVYKMFDMSFGNMGLIMVVLFLVFQTMLYAKTRNLSIMFVTGIFFASLYALSAFVEPFSVQIIFFILVLELAGIILMLFISGRR